MTEQELIIEIAKMMQGRYRHFVAIEDHTKEIAQALQRGDNVSTSLMLEMRKEEMLGADGYMDHIEELLDTLEDPAYIHQIRQVIRAKEEPSKEEPLRLLYELAAKTKQVAIKTMEIDKVMNKRIAGKHSIYNT